MNFRNEFVNTNDNLSGRFNNHNYNKLQQSKIPHLVDKFINPLPEKDLFINPNFLTSNTMSLNNPYTVNSLDIENKNEKVYKIDINSGDRNLIPKNILDTSSYTLANPLFFKQDSNQVIVVHPNHPYEENDKIIMSNIVSLYVTLRNPFVLTANSEYVQINHPNHGLTDILTKYYQIFINIANTTGNVNNGSYINEIPVTLFNTTHQVYLRINSTDIINPNYYFIKLPIVSLQNYTDTNNIIELTYLDMEGIPLYFLNADYPLNMDRQVGYQLITSIVDSNSYIITISSPAVRNTGSIGYGGNVVVQKIINTIDGYPEPNNYIINLKKTFYNVKKIRLISSVFPITETAIQRSSVNQNNYLYWQILNDGDTLYNCQIDAGNYDINELIMEMTNKIKLIIRPTITVTSVNDPYNSYIEYNQYFDVTITIDGAKNIFSIEFFADVTIMQCITKSILTYTDNHSRMNINQYNHGFSIGNTIIISGAIATDGIPIEIINSTFTIETIIDSNNYTVRLPLYNSDDSMETKGGNAINIKFPLQSRLRFDQPYTLGYVLGFQNPGSSTSITSFNYINQNNLPYANNFTLNSTGQNNLLSNGTIQNNLINLSNINYIYMVTPIDLIDNSNEFSIVTANLLNVLAKINLFGEIGSYIYDSYVMIAREFEKNIPTLTELQISFYRPNATLYEFNGMDHSFTLEITEDLTELMNTDQDTQIGR